MHDPRGSGSGYRFTIHDRPKSGADKYRNIEIQVEISRKSISNTKSMLTVKLDFGFRLNLYLEFDISVADFDIQPHPTKDRHKSGVKE